MRDRLVQAPGAVQSVPALQVPTEVPVSTTPYLICCNGDTRHQHWQNACYAMGIVPMPPENYSCLAASHWTGLLTGIKAHLVTPRHHRVEIHTGPKRVGNSVDLQVIGWSMRMRANIVMIWAKTSGHGYIRFRTARVPKLPTKE